MTIYTRFGDEVQIIAYVGEDTGQNAFGEKSTGEWVRVRAVSDGKERDVLISDLRADGGLSAIMEAVEAAKREQALAEHEAELAMNEQDRLMEEATRIQRFARAQPPVWDPMSELKAVVDALRPFAAITPEEKDYIWLKQRTGEVTIDVGMLMHTDFSRAAQIVNRYDARYTCQACGHVEPNYLPRCPRCGQFNTLVTAWDYSKGPRPAQIGHLIAALEAEPEDESPRLPAPSGEPTQMESIHVCNDATTRIPVKQVIGFTYEDRDLASAYAAEALVEFLSKYAPGQFVHIHTGDYIHAPCSHPECENYDAAYWHYLVPKTVWNECKDKVLYHDRVWREANSTCKRTGRFRLPGDPGYSRDCPACERGLRHTDAEHVEYLQRNEDASKGDWESLDPPTANQDYLDF